MLPTTCWGNQETPLRKNTPCKNYAMKIEVPEKKIGCCFWKKKYVQESQVNLDYLTTKKHSPTNISTLSIWSSFFLKPQQNHMLFFPMFWHFCVAPTNRPQDSGQFLYKSLTWMFRPFWGPENSLIKPTFWGFPNRRELGRYTVNCLAS